MTVKWNASAVAGLLVGASVLVQAEPAFPIRTLDAESRIEIAFGVASTISWVEPTGTRVATKGDLPVPPNCYGVPSKERAKCIEATYTIPSDRRVIMETRTGNTSILVRRIAAE